MAKEYYLEVRNLLLPKLEDNLFSQNVILKTVHDIINQELKIVEPSELYYFSLMHGKKTFVYFESHVTHKCFH